MTAIIADNALGTRTSAAVAFTGLAAVLRDDFQNFASPISVAVLVLAGRQQGRRFLLATVAGTLVSIHLRLGNVRAFAVK